MTVYTKPDRLMVSQPLTEAELFRAYEAIEAAPRALPEVDQYVESLHRQLNERIEDHVASIVGIEFRQSTSVRIARPRWMPDFLYRRLMRTIVVTTGPLIVGNPMTPAQEKQWVETWHNTKPRS